MPTRNISLTKQQDDFVEEVVRSGEYQNASEAVRDALRALQQRRREDEMKLERLRMAIKEGIEDLEAGRFEELDEAGLSAYLDDAVKRSVGRRR